MSTDSKMLNKDMIDLYKSSEQYQQRKNTIHKMNRWNAFREERTKLIDRYMALRKLKERAEFIVKQVYIKKIFKKVSSNLVIARKNYHTRLRGRWLAMLIAIKWKNKHKKYGPNMMVYDLNRIRQRLTFTAQVTHDNHVKFAK